MPTYKVDLLHRFAFACRMQFTSSSLVAAEFHCDLLVQKRDLSRFSAAPRARLGHLAFESDRAFPAQC